MNVTFAEEAARDVEEADAWWRANRDARELFSDELVAAVYLLGAVPGAGQQLARSSTAHEFRRLVLRKTRYLLFYELDANGVVILRVWHPARGPSVEPKF